MDLKAMFVNRLNTERVSPDTVNNYLTTIRSIDRFMTEHFSLSVTSEDVKKVAGYMLDAWVNSMAGTSDASKVQYINRARRYFRWLNEMGFTEDDLSTALPKINLRRSYAAYDDEEDDDEDDVTDDDRVYSDQEIIQMMNIAFNGKRQELAMRNTALIALLAGSGMRSVEVEQLNVRTIRNAKNQTIRVRRKGGRRGNVAIASFAFPIIEQYLEMRDAQDDEPLFTSRSGKRMSRKELQDVIRKIQTAAGVRTGIHNFRHTVITHIAQSNSSGVAALIAGHTTDAVTKRHYIHPTMTDRASAINGLSINSIFEHKN